ncbi:MAG TPA: hypothetical protein VF498_08690 [Anaerolineales bacterium]
MMLPDIPPLAQQLAPLVLPALPYLLKGAKKVGDILTTAGQKAGEIQWDVVFKIWEKIHPQVEQQPEVKKRLEEVAQKPDDPRAATLLSWDLEKVLAALKPDELTEIQNTLNQSRTEKRTTIAKGERSVAIGGDASGNTIITGDDNLAEK